jgi:predicted ATPase
LAKIAAAGVQVVVETHSEHVINGIRIAALKDTISTTDVRINFFDRDENDKIKLIPILMNDAGDLTSYPKGFFDQEQRDMAEIIRQKRNKMGNKS